MEIRIKARFAPTDEVWVWWDGEVTRAKVKTVKVGAFLTEGTPTQSSVLYTVEIAHVKQWLLYLESQVCASADEYREKYPYWKENQDKDKENEKDRV